MMIVYAGKDSSGDNLLTSSSLIDICTLHNEKVRQLDNYTTYFMSEYSSFHIPNYVALFSGRASCFNITDEDVATFVTIMTSCASSYNDGSLKQCALASMEDCQKVSSLCLRGAYTVETVILNAIDAFNIFYVLADTAFADNQAELTYTMSVEIDDDLDTEAVDLSGEFMYPIYTETYSKVGSIEEGSIEIVAYHFHDLKFEVFQASIVSQVAWIAIGIAVVVISITIYARSIFLSIVTVLCIIFSMVMAYFVYGRILDIVFFPFMNVVTLIFIVGIGADDVFVYCGVFREAQQVYIISDGDDRLEYIVKWTTHCLRHALLAMFTTSCTTAVAFYANMLSNIPIVKLFGLFSGTAVICNYLLVVTFLPACVVIHERYLVSCTNAIGKCCRKKRAADEVEESNQESKPAEEEGEEEKEHEDSRAVIWIKSLSNRTFNVVIRQSMLIPKYFWVFLGTGLGIGFIVVTFSSPGLQYPETSLYQAFVASHPVEQYDFTYGEKFAIYSGPGEVQLPITFVFGVKTDWTASLYDPDDDPTLLLDNELNITDDQVWLKTFCTRVTTSAFYVEQGDVCAQIIAYYGQLELECEDGNTVCCGKELPIDNEEFETCFKYILDSDSNQVGFHFDDSGKIRALRIDIQSVFYFGGTYQYNQELFTEMETWFQENTEDAPDSFSRGYWWMELGGYDLQTALGSGLKVSLGVALGVAFSVILLTTLNLLLSFYSIVSITFVISTTCGILILSGWRINIIESLIFSVSAGLAADFTLHYSVAYKASLIKGCRIERTKFALTHMGPSIMMGAFTTFMAGKIKYIAL